MSNKVHAAYLTTSSKQQQNHQHSKGKGSSKSSFSILTRINLLFEKLPLQFKLFCIVIFAFLSMIAMAAVLISNASQNLIESQWITKISTMTTVMSDLVDSIQIERGASSLFLAANGTEYQLLVSESRNKTNVALKAFMELKPSVMKGLDPTYSRHAIVIDKFSIVDGFIQAFPTLRINIDKLNFDKSITATNLYTSCNTAMIEAITVLCNLSEDSKFMILQSAFNIIISMKEFNGQMRAFGGAAYTSRSMPYEVLLQFLQSQARAHYDQDHLQLRDVFGIWGYYNKTVLSSESYRNIESMEEYLLNNYQQLNSMYSGPDWFQNMTLHMNNMRMVENYISNLSLEYGSKLNRQSIGNMVAFICSTVLAAVLSILVAMVFSKSIASPWKKIVELQRLQETYKSFIPAHVLSQIEGNDEIVYQELEDEEKAHESSRVSHSVTGSSSKPSSVVKRSKNAELTELKVKFSLYLENKSVSMIGIRIEGLDQIIPQITPNELVRIVQDFFERVENVSKSTGSLMEPSTNFGVSLSFNASKDQGKHDERAVKACLDLSDRLKELQKNNWNHNTLLKTCDFSFAVYNQQCLCGNVGTNDTKVFKIIGPIHENLNMLLDCAKALQVRVVCDEYLAKKVAQSSFHTRFVSFIDLQQENYEIQFERKVYEIGAKLAISEDEWLYELANKEKNEQWVKYNEACNNFFANDMKKALIGFEEFGAKFESDLPTKQMIKLCCKELSPAVGEVEVDCGNVPSN